MDMKKSNSEESNIKDHPPDTISNSTDSDANLATTSSLASTNNAVVTTSSGGEQTSSEQSRGSSPSEDGQENLLQKKWEEMFDRLLSYREKHGDCLVPNRYVDDPQLGNWVSTQRRQYKILQEGGADSTPMTRARAEKLESIGFKWSTKDPRHVPWMTRYKELVEFKDKYGHSQVPIGWEENIQLSNWVSTQRQEYKLLQKGRSSRLTDDRIDLLNKVDFIWEAQRGGPRRRRKATVQVPSRANPVEGVGPRPSKRPAYGTTTPQAASLQGFQQGFPMIQNPIPNVNPTLAANVNAAAAIASQILQSGMTAGFQMPWHTVQHGTFQAQGALPQNMMLPMATAQYTQWLTALSALASANVAAGVSSQQNDHHDDNAATIQPGQVSAGQLRDSSSPKTVSMTESDQRDSDQKTSENGDDGSSDDNPSSSDQAKD